MIEILWLIFDVMLALLLLTLAWVVCASHHIKRAITYFIAFGLLLALTWARLRAADVALAEAIIGAGISGALLLIASRDYADTAAEEKLPALVVWGINLMTLALFVVMAWAVWDSQALLNNPRLSEPVAQNIALSGVTNPVTAVLLNFRAYDTLLELAVVLTAILALLSLGPVRSSYKPAGPMLSGMLRWLVPALVMTSGYLLWAGAHAPGGAFQAGAMLAAAVILLHQGNLASGQRLSLASLRWILVAGIAAFIVVGVWMMLMDRSFLGYVPHWSGALILMIESAATFSIAAALSLAYLGGRLQGWEPQAAVDQGDRSQ